MVFLRLLTGGTRSKTPSSHNVFLLVFPQRVIYNPCPYICFCFNFTKTFLLAPSYIWPHIVFGCVFKGNLKKSQKWNILCIHKPHICTQLMDLPQQNFAWPIDHQLLQEASIYDRLILGLNVNIQFLKSAIISTPVHISCRVLPSLERLALMLWDCCGPGG